jgi:hypothetical protein
MKRFLAACCLVASATASSIKRGMGFLLLEYSDSNEAEQPKISAIRLSGIGRCL